MPIVSKDAVERDFARRLSLNGQILKSPYWVLPVDDVGHEGFMPVGRGVRSSTLCGSHRSFSVCDNIEGHEGKFLNGVDCTGKVIVRHNHLWCKKSSCPVCFIRGWSVDRARSVEGRLLEAERRGFGKIEHVVVSVAVADRGLPESVMRKKCRDALKDRGVVGGAMIFHGYRIDMKRRVLVWSPHYHALGFIEGGFDRCRDCVHERGDCLSCDCFKGREVRGYAKDGYLVKVLPERKTVFGTAFYQLNHATVRLGIKRFHCLTWFGSCAKRMFKSAKVEPVEVLCPLCENEMVKSMHMGSRHIVKDIGNPDYQAVFADDLFDENGERNWVAVVGRVG